MNERVEQLARAFEQANEELIAILTACGDEEWRRRTIAEDRTVEATACHIGEDHALLSDWARSISEGRDIPAMARRR